MKSPDFNLAMNTIEDIVKFDLFGVQCECRSKPLLEELFWPINVTASYELQVHTNRKKKIIEQMRGCIRLLFSD